MEPRLPVMGQDDQDRPEGWERTLAENDSCATYLLKHLFEPWVECPACVKTDQFRGCRKILALITFFTRHHQAEEAAMRQADFPDAVAHARHHRRFLDCLQGLERPRLCRGGARKLRGTIEAWRADHRLRYDISFAEWTARRGKGK